jgi:signal transduction histidine kinase
MHDDITQRLAAAAIECGQLQKHAELAEESHRVVAELSNSLIQLSTDVHRLSRRMHPSILDDLGLFDALLHECNSARSQSKIELGLRCGPLTDALPKDIQLCIYRIVQECIRNILKHSQATRAEIVLSGDEQWVHLQASDNGRGIPPANRDRTAPGLGLVAMEERVQLVGGAMSITSGENCGTRIDVRLPTSLAPDLLEDTWAVDRLKSRSAETEENPASYEMGESP